MTEPDTSDTHPTARVPPAAAAPAQPMPAYAPPAHHLGYPPGMTNPYGYPTGPMMMPPPGYPVPPPGYPVMPPGYPMPPAGYPMMPPGYPMMMPPGSMPPAAAAMPIGSVPPVAQPISPAAAAPPAAREVAQAHEASPAAAPASLATPITKAPSNPAPADPAPPLPHSGLRPGPAATITTAATRGPNRFARLWQQVGGGSLTLSLLIHAGIVLAAGLVVFTTALQEKQVDFLPGGGTQQSADAAAALSHQIQQKKRSLLKKSLPKQRLISTSTQAAISLPDAPPDLLDVPDVSSLIGGGKMGASGGFGRGGAGGGFGNGLGSGSLSGITFKPLMMFGMELKDTRKIAVVMDVSRSMTRYLPIVAKELDKVARGSPLVLYFGCGLKTPPRGLEDKVRKVSDPRFDKFWYYWEGKHEMDMLRKDYDKLKLPEGEPMPLNTVYQQMKNRSNTYFIDFNGITYTSPALTCKEVMEADTVYWFSDFQDAVDIEHVKDVMRKLRGRKQKLYMHASVRGNSFGVLRDELCAPLGGEVLETKVD